MFYLCFTVTVQVQQKQVWDNSVVERVSEIDDTISDALESLGSARKKLQDNSMMKL